jgi:hypothetical protein
MTFTDLEIRILSKRDGGYPVEITCNGEVEFPAGVLTEELPRPNQLFDWLFADPKLLSAWSAAQGQYPRRRIRLRIDAGAPELHALRWEALEFASVDSTPFSRYIPGPWVPGSPVLQRPVRILVAVASPKGLEDLDLVSIDFEAEFKRLEEALSESADFELVRLEGPCTLPALDEALRNNIHILHFIGHGIFNGKNAHLLLCNPAEPDRIASVSDTDLASMFSRLLKNSDVADESKLRMVYLSSCETGSRSPADAFLGLAPQLVAAGVPAVLAMQDRIAVSTATEFSRVFYRELIADGQVDRAANAARSGVLSARLAGPAIPLLFLRLRNGQLLGKRGMIVGDKGESFWETLLGNIAAKDCTPFLGPRITGELLPDPEEVARQLATKFKYPFSDEGNLPRVTQFIGTIDKTRLRKNALSILTSHFRSYLELPPAKFGTTDSISALATANDWKSRGLEIDEAEIHHQLADLELPLYLTTNIDNFMALALEKKVGNARREVIPWRDHDLVRRDLNPPATAEQPVVVHLFGVDTDLLSLVLTEDDHLDYLARISHDHEYFLPVQVNERLASTTLLFLGYRLEDLDLKVIVRGLLTHLDLERWDQLHVAVQLESSQRDQSREQEIISYFEKYFRNFKMDIYWGSTRQFMSDLSARWKEYRRAQ